jgi:hypothetical protein
VSYRKSILSTTFASHYDLAGFPADIVQTQVHDFSGAQAQARQKQQDCVIAFSDRRALIAAVQEPFNLFGLQKLWQLGETPP